MPERSMVRCNFGLSLSSNTGDFMLTTDEYVAAIELLATLTPPVPKGCTELPLIHRIALELADYRVKDHELRQLMHQIPPSDGWISDDMLEILDIDSSKGPKP